MLVLAWLAATLLAPPPELRDGDIVLHRGRSTQANAIIEATNSPYTHVGIIDVTQAGIDVIEAVGPVRRTSLADFVARSVGAPTFVRHFAVNAVVGEAIVRAAERYLGRPYDPYFLMDARRIYCSELVWRAFGDAGLSIGTVQRFADLNLAGDAVDRLLAKRWQAHPRCKKLRNRAQCRAKIAQEKIITPVGLTPDPHVQIIPVGP